MQQTILQTIEAKPSKALRAALNGLDRQELRRDWVTNFQTFGTSQDGFCFGCLATVALQELAGVNLDSSNIGGVGSRASATGFCRSEVFHFEGAIDFARRGYLTGLFRFCSLVETVSYNFVPDCPFDRLKIVLAIEQLEANGL